MKNILFLSFLLIVLNGCTDSNEPTNSSHIEIKEFSLGKEHIIDRNMDWSIYYTSGERNGKSFYIVNGKEEKSYDIVYNFIFSPNGKRYAYIGAEVNGDSVRNYFVVDGKEVKSYSVLNYSSMAGRRLSGSRLSGSRLSGIWAYPIGAILFSPDSKRVAFSARSGDKSFIVLDGEKRRGYDQIGLKVFSPDSKRFAYSVKDGSKWFVIIDRKKEKEYDNIACLTFSPDSRKFAYIASDRKIFGFQENSSYFINVTKASSNRVSHSVNTMELNSITRNITLQKTDFSTRANSPMPIIYEQRVVIDGVEGKIYGAISPLTFSPDSKTMVYAAGQHSSLQFVVIDGIEVKQYEKIMGKYNNRPPYFYFSPDSKRLAYVIWKKSEGKQAVVIDGVEGKGYQQCTNFMFSSDSKRYSYIGYNYIDGIYTKNLIVDGNEIAKNCNDIRSMKFASDSNKLFYCVQPEPSGKWHVSIDGNLSEGYESLGGLGGDNLSINESSVCFRAKRNGKWVVVVDGIEGKQYDLINQPFFYDNEVVYWARNGEKSFIFMGNRYIDVSMYQNKYGLFPVIDEQGVINATGYRDDENYHIKINFSE